MANALTQKPIIIDTDLVSYRADASVIALGGVQGVRVQKLVLSVGPSATSTAGTITITAPSDSKLLYPPLVVGSTIAANTILFSDEPTAPESSLTWRDFAVTGVTATATRLFLWVVV
jgi:hypothetical protein